MAAGHTVQKKINKLILKKKTCCWRSDGYFLSTNQDVPGNKQNFLNRGGLGAKIAL